MYRTYHVCLPGKLYHASRHAASDTVRASWRDEAALCTHDMEGDTMLAGPRIQRKEGTNMKLCSVKVVCTVVFGLMCVGVGTTFGSHGGPEVSFELLGFGTYGGDAGKVH